MMRYFVTLGDNDLPVTMISGPLPDQPGMTEITKEQYEQYKLDLDNTPKAIEEKVDDKRFEFRSFRAAQFNAFDIYKTNLAYGVISETPSSHTTIANWYNKMLNFTEEITEKNYTTITFPTTPEEIAKYL